MDVSNHILLPPETPCIECLTSQFIISLAKGYSVLHTFIFKLIS